MKQTPKPLPQFMRLLWRICVFLILSFSVLFIMAPFSRAVCLGASGLTAVLLALMLFVPKTSFARVFRNHKGWRILFGAGLGLGSFAAAVLFAYFWSAMPHAVYEPVDVGYTQSDFVKNQKALVLAPHEDDDVNMAGAVMASLRRAGAQVSVAFMTNGDKSDGAAVRLNEAINCMKALNIPEKDLYFLGYGDEWQGSHIYNKQPEEPAVSFVGYTETYGLPNHPDFATQHTGHPRPYTRSGCLQDVMDLIMTLQPDVIYCTDYDYHPDHRLVSMMFDEAMGLLMAQDPEYRPVVFKSISYLTGWHAPDDFFTIPMKMTQCPQEEVFPLGTPTYRWEERVRFPVPNGFASYTVDSNEVTRLHRCYASQDAEVMSDRVASSDQVFFERRTDSLLYGQKLTASSGDASVLTDFKLFDTSDIRAFVFDEGIWSPGDEAKTVRVDFDRPVSLDTLTLWENPSDADNVLAAKLTLSDGTVVDIPALDVKGASNTISFPRRDNIIWAELSLTQTQGERAGLTEWELACRQKRDTQFIKLTNAEDNFIYETPAAADAPVQLGVYAWPSLPQDAAFTLTARNEDNGEERRLSGLSADELVLEAPGRGTWRVRVTCEQDPGLYDECVIQSGKLMLQKRIVQKFEQHLRALKRMF